MDSVVPVEGVAGGGTAYGWNDAGRDISNRTRDAIDPSEVPTSDLVNVWCMPSSANVGSQDMPKQLDPINFLAARNERESFQVALRPKASWGGSGGAGTVQILCTDLVSTSGDRLVTGEAVTLRRVAPIYGIPDALVPFDLSVSQICLFPGETTVIWVSIDVPGMQPPGLYEGEFVVAAAKTEKESYLQMLGRTEKQQLYVELSNCLNLLEHIEGKSINEAVESLKTSSSCLRQVLLSPSFAECSSDNVSVDIMDEDAIFNLSVRIKIYVTVWGFVLPVTPSLPVVFGISDTVIEDRFGVEHGSEEWYAALEQHFKWLLQYRISPFFCRWGQSMRVLAYTCPWPADHPKADDFYSDERLAAYAVPYAQPVASEQPELFLQKEIDTLRKKPHWKKAYFYLWDEPLSLEHYSSMSDMAIKVHSHAPDARVLTTYYCGPNDAPLATTPYESFVKVPKFLRPHTQIYCTSEWVLGNREDLVKEIVSEIEPQMGEEWWTYVCMGPGDPYPNWHLGMRGTQQRAVMWRVWKEGAGGFLYWGANCYERASFPSAEITFRRGLPLGDGVLFYPGQVFSASHPVASVRLERILSGLQDVEYLKLYESMYGRDECLALLQTTGVYVSPEKYTSDHLPIDVMRAHIFSRCSSS